MAGTTASPAREHVEINDRIERAVLASRLGVTEERLRKAVRMVGTRINSIADYLRH